MDDFDKWISKAAAAAAAAAEAQRTQPAQDERFVCADEKQEINRALLREERLGPPLVSQEFRVLRINPSKIHEGYVQFTLKNDDTSQEVTLLARGQAATTIHFGQRFRVTFCSILQEDKDV